MKIQDAKKAYAAQMDTLWTRKRALSQALKNCQQFLILLQRAAVGGGPAAARVGLVLLLRLPGGGGNTQPPLQPAGNMGAGGDLVPLDKIPGPVGAEH